MFPASNPDANHRNPLSVSPGGDGSAHLLPYRHRELQPAHGLGVHRLWDVHVRPRAGAGRRGPVQVPDRVPPAEGVPQAAGRARDDAARVRAPDRQVRGTFTAVLVGGQLARLLHSVGNNVEVVSPFVVDTCCSSERTNAGLLASSMAANPVPAPLLRGLSSRIEERFRLDQSQVSVLCHSSYGSALN